MKTYSQNSNENIVKMKTVKIAMKIGQNVSCSQVAFIIFKIAFFFFCYTLIALIISLVCPEFQFSFKYLQV